MATTIKLKNGSGAPAASDLVQGEPAIDLTNKRLYTEDSGGNVIEVGSNPSSLSIDGTAVTATAAEINTLDGITSSTAELNILDGVTSTAAELNILDGVTATTAEINILDGVTSSTAELNILDGVTATTAELNILDGVTSTTAELNILDGVTATAAELNVLDGVTAFVDEDDMSSDSATSIPSQQSVKAYVDSQVAGKDSLSELGDTNITSPADGALLFYDTGTSKWIDNVVSGDITIADTGVAAIGSGVIVNADVNASAAIDVSKTALTAGTGLTLSTNTLSVDASQTQITAVGTIGTGTWQGTPVADAYVANDLTISGGTVDNTVIGGTTPAAATLSSLVASSLTYPTSDGTSGQAIITDGSGTLSFGDVSGGGGGITYVTKTANYTMSAGEGVIANTSGGTFTITLPASPSTGDQVIIADGSNWATTNLTVGRNGSTIEGVAADLTCDVEGISVTMVYDGSTWQLYPQTGTSPSLGIDDNATSTAVTIDSSGNVGIGTTSPSDKLHVYSGAANGSAHSYSQLVVENSTHNAIQLLSPDDTEQALWFGDASSSTAGGVTYYHPDNLMTFRTNASERMRIHSDGDVSIGTSTAGVAGLSIDANKNLGWTQSSGESLANMFRQTTSGALVIGQGYQRSATANGFASSYSSSLSRTAGWFGDSIRFYTDTASTVAAGTDITPTERVRIDSSGNVFVGTTDTTLYNNSGSGNGGIALSMPAAGAGRIDVARDGNNMTLNRLDSDGEIIEFYRSGSSCGKIHARSNSYLNLLIGSTGTGITGTSFHAILPSINNSRSDNSVDLGHPTYRWNDAHITNGVTTGSDERLKQDIAELDAAETRVAVACKGLLRKWRWKDMVEAKDNNTRSNETARIHFGIVAQDLKAAFEAEGLDAGRYGMFVHTTWTDEETGEERDRMGVRYSELLAFIIAAI